MAANIHIKCIECELTDDYPCEKWGVCPNDDDFLEKLLPRLKDKCVCPETADS